jgi:hypothetical protein
VSDESILRVLLHLHLHLLLHLPLLVLLFVIPQGSAFVLAVALASEIGPGFSPDIAIR